MPPIPGQHRHPFATQRRDITVAKQELTFPRGPANHQLFHNQDWVISKDTYKEVFNKHACCDIKKGGHPTSIDCRFKRLNDLTVSYKDNKTSFAR